jgi:hypothetical protein
VELDLGFVFVLGCFFGVFRVWALCLFHTVYVEAMEQCGSVDGGTC